MYEVLAIQSSTSHHISGQHNVTHVQSCVLLAFPGIKLPWRSNPDQNPPTRVGVTWKYLMQDPNGVGQPKI